MICSIQINSRTYKFNVNDLIDISIPLDFNGAQPNAYGVEKASSKACKAGAMIGDTRRGGSCNFEQYEFIPHCNGTHTESIGHLTNERIAIRECLQDAFIPAALVTIQAVSAAATDEIYSIDLTAEDSLITKKSLSAALNEIDGNWLDGLIVRTLPNNPDKKHRQYADTIPPFFTLEAMNFIVEKKVRHLLVDTPSIDRVFDEGKLAAHRIFWNVEPGSFEANSTSRKNNTVTELIYVPEEIRDGIYLLNLQIAPFAADVSPSRPVLFAIGK